MRKTAICILLAFIILMFSACGGKNEYTVHNDTQNEATVRESEEDTEILYLVNTSSMIYHLPTCNSVKRTDEKNLEYSSDEDFLLRHGYRPCSVCLKSTD
ncbi:MAG: Ada metal-binding domain-containing protein [Eubacteriales bacterium]